MKKTGWSELDDIIDDELDKYAEDVQTTMQSIVHVKTGNLRDSITVETPEGTQMERTVGVDADKLESDNRNKSSYDYSLPYYYGNRKTSWTGHKFLEETMNAVK